jgi:hypothetical protein
MTTSFLNGCGRPVVSPGERPTRDAGGGARKSCWRVLQWPAVDYNQPIESEAEEVVSDTSTTPFAFAE